MTVEGKLFPVQYSSAALFLNGLVLGTVICFRDISERKIAEKRLQEFHSVLSHELRAPLTSIGGSLRLIEGGMTGDVTEDTLEIVRVARTSSDRLVRLTNDLLDVKKIEAGMNELKKVELDPEVVIKLAANGLIGIAHDAGVSISIETKRVSPVLADHDRLIQVLTNLISNAVKFSPQGGTVTVTASEVERACVRFSVTDCGPGIPEDQLSKLFVKFCQLQSPTVGQKSGTGLGLAISKAIVEEHGGRIGVNSRPGSGSTFWFELPISLQTLRKSHSEANSRQT